MPSACISVTNYNLPLIINGGPDEDTRHLGTVWTLKRHSMFSASGSWGQNQGVARATFSSRSPRDKSISTLTQVVSKIQFQHGGRRRIPVSFLAVDPEVLLGC